jgi:hypothetical protein
MHLIILIVFVAEERRVLGSVRTRPCGTRLVAIL